MIKDTVTKKGEPAITSDQWHVVRAHFTGDEKSRHPYSRAIVSEHADRNSCRLAAKALSSELKAEAGTTSVMTRDQIFVRPPHFKSLKKAKRRPPKPR